MKKILAILIFLALIASAGYYMYKSSARQAKAPEQPLTEGEQQTTETPAAQPNTETPKAPAAEQPAAQGGGSVKQSEGTYSSGEELADAPDIQVVAVSYDGSKFEPATVNIKVGDWVFFKNDSAKDFWPASGNHPTHTLYPEFDAKKAIAPGQQFKFQFEKAGDWSFHDHLNPAAGGVVHVTP